jgi:hypothetical protein
MLCGIFLTSWLVLLLCFLSQRLDEFVIFGRDRHFSLRP